MAEVTGHSLVYGPPKTFERRVVPIPRTLAEELEAHLAGRRPHSDDFVFTAAGGGPLRHHNLYRRHFKPAVAAAGLPGPVRFGCGSLRGTFSELRRPASASGAAA